MTPSLSSLITGLAPALANHLWQSTAFVAAIWIIAALLRRNRAQVRHALWLTASFKFLLPYSLLVALGDSLLQPRHAPVGPQVSLYSAIDIASQPFLEAPVSHIHATPHSYTKMEHFAATLPAFLLAIWLVGALIVLLRWTIRWRQVSAMCRRAVRVEKGREFEVLRRLEVEAGSRRHISVLLSSDLMEPGIFGMVRPVLLWPRQLSEHLQEEHIEAILAHELMHVQRRDNLTAALHMLVEALFWFHPVVWAIEYRLVEERELACDEAVVRHGGKPEAYAESLLTACRFCIESPIPCVAGITGADLNRRIVAIMSRNLSQNLGVARRALLAAIAIAAIAGPLMFGQVNATLRMAILAPTPPPPPPPPPIFGTMLHLKDQSAKLPEFEAATIRPGRPDDIHSTFRIGTGSFKVENGSLLTLIKFAYNIKSEEQLPKTPRWISSQRFDVDAKLEESQIEALKNLPPERKFEQYRLMVQALLADRFKLQVSYQVKDLPIYALVAAKGGPKLTPIDAAAKNHLPTLTGNQGQLKAGAISMDFFTGWLSGRPEAGNRAVVDATGLKDRYDFTLNWTPEDLNANAADTGQLEAAGPSIFTAIQEQLGLKLESAKGPVETLVIDHVERPSQN